MDNISKHISYIEATRSDTGKRLGIANDPDSNQLLNMQNLATAIFEPLREYFNKPIYISSFFRSSVLNKAIKGSTSSQHLKGQAIDLDGDTFGSPTNKEIFEYIKNNLDFDQLIAEGINDDDSISWVHCSYVSPDKNRHQVLTMKLVGKLKVYELV